MAAETAATVGVEMALVSTFAARLAETLAKRVVLVGFVYFSTGARYALATDLTNIGTLSPIGIMEPIDLNWNNDL